MSLVLDYPLTSLSAAVAAFIVARKLIEARTCSIRHLPEPNGAHWFWGHELTTHESPYGQAHTTWIDTYGPTYKIKGALFHPDILVTVDPAALSHMFGKEVYSYVKSPVIRPIIDRLMGKSLPWAEGSTHKRQRQQLTRFFTTQATRDMFDAISVCARTGSERIAARIAESGGDPKQGIKTNIADWTSPITLDVIGRFAFSYDFESGRSEASQVIQRCWKEQVDLGFHRAALIALSVIRALPFIVDLPIRAIQAQGEVKTTLRRIAQSIINNGVEDKGEDLLRTLIRLAEKGEVGASREELLDHISTMVLVGQETTSGSLNFTLHELARHPEYQTRLREEIAQLGREPTYEDLMSGMPWLDAVMKESFRHRPLVSHTERVAMKDDVIRLRTPVFNDRGHKITEIPVKAGQLIHIPSIAITHMKSVWGADADEFRPERWLDPARLPPASETCSGWNGLFIFSEGPRQCIGLRLAILSFKVILTTFIRNFEFHDTGATVHARFSTTLQPYVVGEEDKGTQLPLRVSIIDQNA